jgi:sulfite exporter TauE/SafE
MLGFLGTGHCMGMCGPLVVAFPGQTGRFTAHLAYHAGRLITYALIGGLMGAAGSGLACLATHFGGNPMLWVSRIQVGIGLVAGLFLLFFGLSRVGFIAEPNWLAIAHPNRLPGWQFLVCRAGDKRGNRELLLLGLFLGGLPCGLSYAAFAKSLSSTDIFCGAFMALLFGLGTLPGLLAIGVGAAFLFHRFRQQTDILAGLIMVGMAAMLLVNVFEVVWV